MSKCKILVVDDEPHVVKLIARLLETKDYQVTCAYSGQEALNLMKNESFNIISTDMRMPEMNGEELLVWVRSLYPATRRILITGIPDFGKQMQHMFDTGLIQGYIAKPWATDGLLKLMAEHCALSNSEDAA